MKKPNDLDEASLQKSYLTFSKFIVFGHFLKIYFFEKSIQKRFFKIHKNRNICDGHL